MGKMENISCKEVRDHMADVINIDLVVVAVIQKGTNSTDPSILVLS